MKKYSKPTCAELMFSENELLCQSGESQNMDGIIYDMPFENLGGDL